jgi:hypothetical protein
MIRFFSTKAVKETPPVQQRIMQAVKEKAKDPQTDYKAPIKEGAQSEAKKPLP